MKQRINRKIEIPLGKPDTYRVPYTMGMLLSVQDQVLPTDKLIELVHKAGEFGVWGYDNNDATLTPSYIPTLIIERSDIETDEEYVERLKKEERVKKATEEREHLEYLRLKAKFEA